MTVQWEKVYVFISSTFNDMHAERDYLIKQVFPQLQEWCEKRKLHLVDIDLRWGVTEQDATQNKRVVQVCLERIDACRPFFLCFLGQRRGWVPEKDDISPETYTQYPELEQYAGEASITEIEILHALVNPLHRGKVLNAVGGVKEYLPAEHSFFYLRGPEYLLELPQDLPQLREIYTNEGNLDSDACRQADKELALWRKQKIADIQRPVHSYEARWDAEESTPEIRLPLQCPSTAERGSDAWQKAFTRWADKWKRAGISLDENGEISDPAEREKAEQFNTRLTQGRLTGFTCEGQSLTETILADLKAAIQQRYPEHIETTYLTSLQRELDQQEQFLQAASEGFIEREGDFATLNQYLQADANQIFILTAPGGMGKTSLLARWIDRVNLNREGSETLHYRFIGASDNSTTVDALLHSLLNEIKEVAGKITEDPPSDPNELRATLLSLLQEAGQLGRTVLVLDGLNQLETGLSDIAWLPLVLPLGVKLVVSFRRGEPQAEAYLDGLGASGQAILAEVRPFESLDDRRKLVQAYLSQFLKDLDERHLEALICSEGSSNPLYLKVVLAELRVFGAFSDLGEKIREDFGATPVSAFAGLLRRLENDPAYSPIQPELLVPRIFGWLAHSRTGLTVDELSRLLVQEGFLSDNEVGMKRATEAVYGLLRQIRPYLTRRDDRTDFFYEGFKLAVLECFAESGEQANIYPESRPAQAWHASLAAYFDGQPLRMDTDRQPNRPINSRKVTELPWQLLHAEQWEELVKILTDLVFAGAKITAGMLYDLIGDYDRALAVHDLPAISIMQRDVYKALGSLASRPEHAVQTLYNRLLWNDDLLPPVLEDSLKATRVWLDNQPFWISAQSPPLSAPRAEARSVSFNIQADHQGLSADFTNVVGSSLEGEFEVRSRISGEILFSNQLSNLRVAAVALGQLASQVAYLDMFGNICILQNTQTLRGRRGDAALCWHPLHGVIGVRDDNTLIAWLSDRNEVVTIAANIPKPLIRLRARDTHDGHYVVFISGNRPQVLGIARWIDNDWKSWILPDTSVPLDACVDASGNLLVVASTDRRIRILDSQTGVVLKELAYQSQSTAMIRGDAQHCAFGEHFSASIVFFATTEGQVVEWNWQTGDIVQLEDYRHRQDERLLCLFEVLPDSGQLLISTPTYVKIRAADHGRAGVAPLVTREGVSRHTEPVTACVLTASNKVVSCSRLGHSLEWATSDGLEILRRRQTFLTEITAIASYGDTDNVLIGDSRGSIAVDGLDLDPDSGLVVILEPVVAICDTGGQTAVVAGETGLVCHVGLKPDRVKDLWPGSSQSTWQKLLPTERGDVWNIRREFREHEPTYITVARLFHGNNYEELTLPLATGIVDAASSHDGAILCLGGDEVRILKRISTGVWRVIYYRDTAVTKIGLFVSDTFLTVVLRDSLWIEVWALNEGLPTVAAFDLPGRVSCLATRNDRIVAGLVTGDLISLKLHIADSVSISGSLHLT